MHLHCRHNSILGPTLFNVNASALRNRWDPVDRRNERRNRIAEAVLELASREGLDHVTLRSVAAEAGISMGQVQHYFATKDDMLLAAVQLATEGMGRRVGERIDSLGDSSESEAVLRAILEEMLGLHPDARRLLRISASILTIGHADPRIAEALTGDDDELVELTVETVREAQREGRVDSRRDPEHETVILWAIAGDLGYQVAHDHRPGDEALDVLRYYLDLLFNKR